MTKNQQISLTTRIFKKGKEGIRIKKNITIYQLNYIRKSESPAILGIPGSLVRTKLNWRPRVEVLRPSGVSAAKPVSLLAQILWGDFMILRHKLVCAVSGLTMPHQLLLVW